MNIQLNPNTLTTNTGVNQCINQCIINFLNEPWTPIPGLENASLLNATREYNSFGINLKRQTGKTTTLLRVFNFYALSANVVLITKSSHTKKVYLESVNSEFKEAVGKRIFTKIKDMQDAKTLFPDNGKRNIVLLDDFSLDGFFSSINKVEFELPLTVLSLSI